MADHVLERLLDSPGEWTFVYTDGRGAEPAPAERTRQRSLGDTLRDAGAPESDRDAVDGALSQGAGVPSPSVRYLLVRNGAVELDETFPGSRLGPQIVGHGPVPPVLPLLRERATDSRYLVVETAREGARISVEHAHRRVGDESHEIEGRTDSLPKVQAGGWSHKRYQMHTEDVWKHNQDEVAAEVDELVRTRRPKFVVVTGDVRARQLLAEQLAPATRSILIEVDEHTKAAGSSDAALQDAVGDALDELANSDISEVRDRASADDGSRGARGVRDVVRALQESRVDTLLLDARAVNSDETLLALDAAPWIATSGEDSLDANLLGAVSAAEALARAAVLTGARVLVAEDELDADEPRPDRAIAPPMAALRWGGEEG